MLCLVENCGKEWWQRAGGDWSPGGRLSEQKRSPSHFGVLLRSTGHWSCKGWGGRMLISSILQPLSDGGIPNVAWFCTFHGSMWNRMNPTDSSGRRGSHARQVHSTRKLRCQPGIFLLVPFSPMGSYPTIIEITWNNLSCNDNSINA